MTKNTDWRQTSCSNCEVLSTLADCDAYACYNKEEKSGLSKNTNAEGIVSSASVRPVILIYNDVDYDWPIEFTVKQETVSLVSVEGWWALGDSLYLPINDTPIETNTFLIVDAIKRVETLLRMGAFIKA